MKTRIDQSFPTFSVTLSLPVVTTIVLVLLGSAATFASWWISRQPRKTKKDCIGFAVSLHCDTDLETEIHDDFITSLRRLILGGPSSDSFDFIEIPARIAAQTLVIQSAQALRLKIACHFLISGRVRKREIDNVSRYFLELDGIVAHREIAPNLHKRFKAEFNELFPTRLEIDGDKSFIALDFTSRITDVVSKYIIGIAMTLSGFYDEAEPMLQESLISAVRVTPKLPAVEKIIERVPIALSAINLVKADAYYSRWRDNGNQPDDLTKMAGALESVTHTSQAAMTLKSICAFLTERDTYEARKILYQVAKPERGGAWEYNQGFLFAYDGNLKKAKQHFVRGAQQRFPLEKTISELELFMCWAVEQEPTRYQLYFALGLLNRHLKSDYARAIQDFQEFLDRAETGKFDREQKLAKLWIGQLEQRLKT